ncbi:fimbria/pilus outer membrane usher protein [Pseudomonas aeruginosa]|uniref:fimbria/pilus outer membrane usher protein n=1 Tax=Pseudomonas aeruginosa TaxID=287 RepID=UPI0039BC9DA8
MPVLSNKFIFAVFLDLRFSLLLFMGVPSVSSALVFNEEFLIGREGAVDLKYLEEGSSVLPGTYVVDVYINSILKLRESIVFSAGEGRKVKPVVSVGLLRKLGVDMDRLMRDGVVPKSLDNNYNFYISDFLKEASIDFEVNDLSLRLSIPQAYMQKSTAGYVDPTLWDEGVAAIFSSYQTNFTRNISYGERNDYRYVGLRNGLNIFGWRLRNDSSFTSGTNTKSKFRSNRTYLERDVRSLDSTIALGELYTSAQGEVFDSVRIRGMQLQTDIGMLPDNEISYTPVVRGVAETNATVEVSQNGFVIYSTSVPPGAFEITDIYPSGSNGDLDVRIIEADGRERVYKQSYSYLPVMTRKGNFRYGLAVGEYSSEGQPSVGILQGTAVYGISDRITGFGGVLQAQKYSASNIGLGLNTPYGGFSVDISNSNSVPARGRGGRGQSVRLLYSKTVNTTGTSFTVIGYRYSTEGYRTLSQHIEELSGQSYLDSSRFSHRRSSFDITVNQSLFQRSSLYLTAGETTYWRRSGSSRRLQFGFSSSVKSASYSLAVSRTQETSRFGRADTQFTASITIPFGQGGRSHQVYANAISSVSGDSSLNTGVSGYLNEDNTLTYSAQANYSRLGGRSGSLGLGLDTSKMKLSAGYSQGPDTSQANLGASGSVVLHGAGVTFGQPVGETFGLVKVTNASGVGLEGYKSIETDGRGYAIVPYMQPYRYNWVSLDSNTLGSDVEVSEASQVVVPTRGSVVAKSFIAEAGRRIQFDLTVESGKTIPFGAQAYDKSGKVIGMVDNLSRLLVFGINDEGNISVRWEGHACVISYKLPPRNPKMSYERVQSTCLKS